MTTSHAPFPLEGGRVGDEGENRRPAAGGVKRARRQRREATLSERLLWAELRKSELKFRRQTPIGPYVADFAHHASRLVIEIDGYYHGTDEGQARDAVRDQWFKTAGYRLMRIPEAQVREHLFETIDRIVAETSPSLPASLPSRERGAEGQSQ